MSAFGTKKPGGDAAVQLTFPTVFENTFAAVEPDNIAFLNALRAPAKELPYGTDLQSLYHEQKRIDSHRRALNAVRDTARSKHRAFTSHAGYYGLPPVVLSQRRFANPSNGSGGIGGDLYPARRDAAPGAPFHCVGTGMVGGVLRSAQGQRWGVMKLRDRVRQLNDIDQSEALFKANAVAEQQPEPMLVADRITQGFEAPTGLTLDIISLLDEIENSIAAYGGKDIDRLAGKAGSEFLKLLLRYGTIANRQQLEALLEQFEAIIVGDGDADSLVTSWATDAAGDRGIDGRGVLNEFPFFGRLAIDLSKAYLYIRAMLAKVDSSAAERKKASETAAKTIGIGTARAGKEIAALLGRIFTGAPEFGAFENEIDADLDGIPDVEELDVDEAGRIVEGFFEPFQVAPGVREVIPPRGRGRARGGARARAPVRRSGQMTSTFTRNAPTREDTMAAEYGMNSVRFDRDVRQAFGDRSGSYLGDPFPGSTPAEAPRNGMRKPKVEAARLPVAPPAQATPTMPDLPAAPVAAAAAQEGMGKKRRGGRKPATASHGITRDSLPKDREGFVALAEMLRGKGHPVRINKNSTLKSIRANFIRKFKL
jgi:hypothetical protein